jgi:hypothetical protein
MHATEDHAGHLESNLAVTTWHHDGLRAFVRELADRLLAEHYVDQMLDPDDPERVRAALTGLDWATVPVSVASELVERLVMRCRNAHGLCFCGYHKPDGATPQTKPRGRS